jgi:DNA-binding winged helix-turn-helix (wHTH) protein
MAVPDSPRAPETRIAGYRFAGVALDLRRGSLSIDGEAVATTPLLLQLLQILCESDGRLLTRQELFDALWPGGQSVSDAALSQLVWRLRSLLGPYGGLVATLRRSGLRLEAPVVAEFDVPRTMPWAPVEPALPSPPEAVAVTSPPDTAAGERTDAAAADVATPSSAKVPASASNARRSHRNRLVPASIAAVVLAAVLAVWLLRDPLVSDGYALRAADLQASRRDTVALMTAAFAAEEAGDRDRAAALMRSLHESDTTTPVPATMLAWWRSHASPAEAATWAAAAQARLRPDSPPYLRLFTGYFVARSGAAPIRGPLNAALDLRPSAWHLQYTRAHDQLAMREFAGALRSLQQMPPDLPDVQVLADVLADRISLGDTAAETLAARQPAIAADSVLAPYLAGRIAYSHGRLAEAIAAWDRSAAAAEEIRQYGRQLTATEYASLAAVELATADAGQRLAATRRLCQTLSRQDCETAMLGFLAVLDARRGDAGRASATLAEAWQLNPLSTPRPALLLLALENGLVPPGDVAEVAAEIATEPTFAGMADLLHGWQALAAGDRDGAGRALDAALERGVAQTYSAEDAALLGARLGRPAKPCRIDPPFPNTLRLTACLQLRELTKSQ